MTPRDVVSGRLPATPADLQQPLEPDAPTTLDSRYRPVAVVRGDARCLGLRDNSVDLIVTSPPYFALRSYQDGGEHYDGQVGAEATPAEFVDTLIACTREWMRVLKPSGSLWVNLGDKYSGAGRGNHDSDRLNNTEEFRASRLRGLDRRQHVGKGIIPAKSLMGIPWRYALRCIDELGLVLRAEVIWSKPNGLPESVTDRVRRSHEQWFHFTLAPRYFSAVDEIREAALYPLDTRHLRGGRRSINPDGSDGGGNTSTCNPLGKLPGSVWTVSTEPLIVPEHLGVDHFAAFPSEWPRRIIQGWSPAGVCVECGEGRRPLSVTDLGRKERDTPRYDNTNHARHGGNGSTLGSRGPSAVITGYACACPEPTAETRPAVVLDPFGGTGTTALVASVLGRVGVTVDLSSDYCRLARWRTADPGERARAMRVEKPPKQINGQVDLFGAAS